MRCASIKGPNLAFFCVQIGSTVETSTLRSSPWDGSPGNRTHEGQSHRLQRFVWTYYPCLYEESLKENLSTKHESIRLRKKFLFRLKRHLESLFFCFSPALLFCNETSRSLADNSGCSVVSRNKHHDNTKVGHLIHPRGLARDHNTDHCLGAATIYIRPLVHIAFCC